MASSSSSDSHHRLVRPTETASKWSRRDHCASRQPPLRPGVTMVGEAAGSAAAGCAVSHFGPTTQLRRSRPSGSQPKRRTRVRAACALSASMVTGSIAIWRRPFAQLAAVASRATALPRAQAGARRLPARSAQRNSRTQSQVVKRLGSSQSRVAKMEAADASVSLDLLVKSLLALGASRGEVGSVIGKAA